MKRLIPPRPRWSLKSSFVLAVVAIGAIVPVVLAFVHKSVWVELEIVTGVVAAVIFLYLTAILYLGVRFNRNERFSVDWPKGRLSDMMDIGSNVPIDPMGGFTEIGSDGGPVGCIVGLLLDLLASGILVFVIALVLWIGLNTVLATAIVILLPLFHFHGRALRGVVAKGRMCGGNLRASVSRAALWTVGYTGWFYTIVALGHYVHRLVSGGHGAGTQ